MDFFEHQQAAHRNTALLIFYFVLAVVLIIAAIYAAAVFVFIYQAEDRASGPFTLDMAWDPTVLAVVAVATLTVIVAGSLYKIGVLRRGGSAVAESLGGTLVASDTRVPQERRLLNVVEEMTIASGTSMPSVYVLKDEPGINAFAAGYSTGDAAVAVTRGALQTLSRDGLQGVIAHEFSHILNGDMRLNTRLMGVLHGILLIGLLGRIGLRIGLRSRSRSGGSRSRGKGGGAIVLIALVMFVVGYIGLFFGNLIKAAVSREREFLADASAVQFTRNPSGLSGALKKIGGLMAGSRLQAPNADMASHLYFANGLPPGTMKMFATHPALDERIRRIEPAWDGTFPEVSVETPDRAGDRTEEGPCKDVSAAASAVPKSKSEGPEDLETRIPLTTQRSVARVGTLDAEHIAYAETLVADLPAILADAAHDPHGVRALVHALLISPDVDVRKNQVDFLHEQTDPLVFEEFRKIVSTVIGLAPEVRLPLLTISLPALRRLSPAQYAAFRDNLNQLIVADKRMSAFELALMGVVRRHLDRYFAKPVPVPPQRQSIERMTDSCGALLSALARIGENDPVAVARAFQAGVTELRVDRPPTLTPEDVTDLWAVSAALNRLVLLKPAHKRRLIAACTSTIIQDGTVTVAEGEILRAVSDSLEVPMPPFLRRDAVKTHDRSNGPWTTGGGRNGSGPNIPPLRFDGSDVRSGREQRLAGACGTSA